MEDFIIDLKLPYRIYSRCLLLAHLLLVDIPNLYESY
jgi:hypothetical protein